MAVGQSNQGLGHPGLGEGALHKEDVVLVIFGLQNWCVHSWNPSCPSCTMAHLPVGAQAS
ncbi:MAG TPA: hypothetical protein VNZ22_01465 [Bacillota bacterium]|nr:hypothetical protein [Bacillota bacterium]